MKKKYPKGGVLVHYYSIFTHDLLHVLNKANIVMYADDSTIFISTFTTKELEIIIINKFKVVAE